jgi:sulfide:quinone oxidoreductase
MTESGKVLGYDYLIVAAGLQIDWDKIKGLKETIGTPFLQIHKSIIYVLLTCQAVAFVLRFRPV